MTQTIVGLGNSGEGYEGTRHNVGRAVLEVFRKRQEFSDWNKDKKYLGLVSKGKLKKQEILLLCPETMMNLSGNSVVTAVKGKSAIEKMVVVHDDLDLPFGTFKISFNRGSGGHRGVESIIKKLKTESFIRIKIGICPTTPGGKLKKPQGEEKIVKFILGKFTPAEMLKLKKLLVKISEALEMTVGEGLARAMNEFNSR